MSRVTAIIPALVICIIVCLSWAVNHYRDNAITYKAQRQAKMPENWKLANAAITDMQMRQRDVAALDAKQYEGVSWMLKPKMTCLHIAAGRRRLHYQQSAVSQCVKPPRPPVRIMQLPPTGRHR